VLRGGKYASVRRQNSISSVLASLYFIFLVDDSVGISDSAYNYHDQNIILCDGSNLFIYYFLMISKFIFQSVVIHLSEWSVRLEWLGERHSVEPLRE
jgi:hypothetical protein